MRSMAADVESVLREFFVLTESGWRHERCDEEIAHMQDKQAKARASAEISVSIRRANAAKRQADAERTLAQLQANAELPTPTPTPIEEQVKVKTNTARKRAAPAVLVSLESMVESGVDPKHAADWLTNRKAKGLAPLTETIWEATKDEAEKAGLTPGAAIKRAASEGWGGFKAKWLTAPDSIRGGQTQPDIMDGVH